MTFHIITIFPDIFNSYFQESIIKRAVEGKYIDLKTYNLRDFTEDKHKQVDDTPFGGGAGMLMKIEPLYKAINFVESQITNREANIKTVLLSAKGKRWAQATAQTYSTKYTDIILICGRYEGVDERILSFIDEEVSIGDFVLTGGEIGAMTLVDSITRLIPGVLGNVDSAVFESHSELGVKEHPHYTRPEVFVDKNGKEYTVPAVLLSGHHKRIEEWREEKRVKQK